MGGGGELCLGEMAEQTEACGIGGTCGNCGDAQACRGTCGTCGDAEAELAVALWVELEKGPEIVGDLRAAGGARERRGEKRGQVGELRAGDRKRARKRGG